MVPLGQLKRKTLVYTSNKATITTLSGCNLRYLIVLVACFVFLLLILNYKFKSFLKVIVCYPLLSNKMFNLYLVKNERKANPPVTQGKITTKESKDKVLDFGNENRKLDIANIQTYHKNMIF